ncbi:MAG: MBL fold metallo-hydrolase [Desulfobacterales bacterium CG07_land_8_20_14_0_80_52_14]|nr:MAG: MBL fold metallo-hydrolase [Desulfobacterales bacterium CG23_combo_of_CG06-09_8_20_14_all_52_9]PIU50509.1 MAG: MBL fold metallo-hydrolase [Desulfobacterales bacterium CG07_land_8_20_14_0_80_52_14]
MKPIEIAKDIYDVGVTDWNIRDFHGYSTYLGTTYNAFLILDEKIVLIDTVKKEFADQYLDHIAQVIDPKKIDIVISNHTEMDHSGSLPRVMHRIGEDKPVICSKMGLKNLSLHYRQKFNYKDVENGEMLSIGKRTLNFLETRMLHWPDSMFTYIKEDGILISSDAFGQHYAGWQKFDDQIGDAIMAHAKKYFANILLLYSPKILKLVETVTEAGLNIRMICPDHGILWRKDPKKIINAYVEWSRQVPRKKALVIYDTMWHSTEKMAEAIADGLISEGIDTTVMHLRKWHRSDIMTEVLDAGALIVGSPTLNNGLFPTVADFLTYMKGLKPKNKIAGAFGSYGWSGESVKFIQQELESMKFDVMEPGIRIQYAPDPEGIKSCTEFGKQIGQKLKAPTP